MHFHTGEVAEARAMVLTHHYSGRWPSNVQVVGSFHEDGGLFGDSGPMVAACVFSIPPTRWRVPVLELIRLVRRPDSDVKLSGLVSRTAKFAHSRGWPLLVSFADTTVGHHGGIYQACSWAYGGQRDSRMDGLVIDGRFLSGRTCNHVYGTQSPAKLRERGIAADPHFDTGKHLYWKADGRRGMKVAAALDLASLPYPKPNVEVAA